MACYSSCMRMSHDLSGEYLAHGKHSISNNGIATFIIVVSKEVLGNCFQLANLVLLGFVNEVSGEHSHAYLLYYLTHNFHNMKTRLLI